jgi:hypothetical protein
MAAHEEQQISPEMAANLTPLMNQDDFDAVLSNYWCDVKPPTSVIIEPLWPKC